MSNSRQVSLSALDFSALNGDKRNQEERKEKLY
jgi:hypothetical protein